MHKRSSIRVIAAAALISSAALALGACSGSRAWQPYQRPLADGGEDQVKPEDHGALEPYYAALRARLGETWASWDVRSYDPLSGQISDQAPALIEEPEAVDAALPPASIRVRSLSSPQAEALVHDFGKAYGLDLVRINRSGRYTPASWDVEVLVLGSAQSTTVQLEFEALMRALSKTSVRTRTWLDALIVRTDHGRVQVRLPRTKGERQELYDVFRRVHEVLTPASDDYELRTLGDEESDDLPNAWTISVEWTPGTREPSDEQSVVAASKRHLWAPEGSGGAAPVRDSNDSMRNHPHQER